MKKILTMALIAAATSAFVPAKASDFGLWTDVGASKKVGLFNFSLEGGVRLQNNWNSIDRWQIGGGVDFKPSAYFSLGASYSFLYNYKNERKEAKYETYKDLDDDGNEITVTDYEGYNLKKPYWRCKNRLNFDVTGKLPVGRFTFSLRERYQYTHANHVKSVVDKYRLVSGNDVPQYKKSEDKMHDADDDSRLRSRFMAEYNIRHCPLSPYAYVELTNNLCSQMRLQKTRVGVGTEFKINKKNKIDVGYVYQYSKDDDFDGVEHVIDISYKYKF